MHWVDDLESLEDLHDASQQHPTCSRCGDGSYSGVVSSGGRFAGPDDPPVSDGLYTLAGRSHAGRSHDRTEFRPRARRHRVGHVHRRYSLAGIARRSAVLAGCAEQHGVPAAGGQENLSVHLATQYGPQRHRPVLGRKGQSAATRAVADLCAQQSRSEEGLPQLRAARSRR